MPEDPWEPIYRPDPIAIFAGLLVLMVIVLLALGLLSVVLHL